MPRVKAKNAEITQTILKKPEEPEQKETPNIDISKFKFEKKPHIKIEYEKESPKKDEEPKGLWEPANWKEFLVNLRNMRSNNDAPVDTMGCHMAMDENAPPKVMRYQSLIALMLSSQTKDQVTFAAMERLRERGLTVDNVLNLTDEELGKLIYPVGFWKTKVKYIKKTTQTLKEQYDGDIPDSVDKLCKLTGVGPKMAHICMQVAWNKTTGIGVDTHVHRISNRIGWVKKPTATPEDTRKALQAWLPFDLWSEVNHLMVGFGQTICQPVNPLCHECLNNDICPSSGKVGRKSPNKKTPLKHENGSSVKEEKISPSKQVLASKKNLITELSDQVKDSSLNIESNPSAPTRKRKVTPKKELEVVLPEKFDDSKFKTNLAGKISPNKKVVSPKKSNKVNDNISNSEVETKVTQGQQKNVTKPNKKHTEQNIDPVDNSKSATVVKLKKSPSKRKATTNKEITATNNSHPEGNEETRSKRITRSNKESEITEPTNICRNQSCTHKKKVTKK